MDGITESSYSAHAYEQPGPGEVNDRRGSERRPCSFAVSWSYFNRDGARAGRVLNYNLSGGYLELDCPMTPGASVLIRVLAAGDPACAYPQGLPMHAVAEVKWCREGIIGSREGYSAGVRYCHPV